MLPTRADRWRELIAIDDPTRISHNATPEGDCQLINGQIMGFRYRRSMRLAPGVRLNITKNGVNSVSLGGPGATVNMGRGGTRTTVGLPGSGLSYSSRTGSGSSLGAGLLIGGLLALVIAALGGSRVARWTLVILGSGFCVLLVAGNSQSSHQSTPTYTAHAATPAVTEATVLTVDTSGVPKPVQSEVPLPTLSSLTNGRNAIVTPVATAAPVSLVPNSVVVQASEEAVTTTTGANVRVSPSIRGAKLLQLEKGTDLLVVGDEAGWAHVKSKDTGEVLGWVSRTILQRSTPTVAR